MYEGVELRFGIATISLPINLPRNLLHNQPMVWVRKLTTSGVYHPIVRKCFDNNSLNELDKIIHLSSVGNYDST